MPNFFTKCLGTIAFILLSFFAYAQTASFHVSDSTATCTYKIMRYQGTSTPGYTSLKWNLGNGIIVTTSADTASAVYSVPGTYHVTLTAYYGVDSSVATMDVVRPANVNISFSADDTDICSGMTVHFTNASTSDVPGTITYEWLINGTTTAVINPSYTFTNTANTYYDIRLRGTNANGCADQVTLSNYIHLYANPHADFSFHSSLCRRPFIETFTNSSTGDGPLSYLWRFPDGTTGTGATPTYTFATLGLSNQFKLIVTNAHGCKDSTTSFASGDSITARFTVDTPICPFAPATFHNVSATQLTSDSSIWLWGDGGRLAQHPITTAQHIYVAGGPETVTLIVKHGTSCADTFTQAINVYPQPDLHFNIPVACNNSTPVTFTPDGSYTYTAWSVNGGPYTASTNLTTAVHYGTNIISMIGTDIHGCRDTLTRLDSVYNMIAGIIYGANINGNTGTTLDYYQNCDSNVHFNAVVYTSQYAYLPYYNIYPSPGVYYSWDFGDGTTDAGDTLRSPFHTYHDTLDHVAYCTITLANGCTITKAAHVQVHHPAIVSFTASPTTVCRHQSVTFTPHLVSGSADVLLVWHYTDGGFLGDPTGFGAVSHTFLHPGIFHPYLEAINGQCIRDYGIPYPIVVDSTWAALNVSYNCANQTEVTFSTSTVHVDSLLWVFGDGTTSTDPTVVHTYPGYGSYSVRITNYGSASGCYDTNYAVIDPFYDRPQLVIPDSAFCPGGHNISLMITGDSSYSFTHYYWYRNGALVQESDEPSVLEIPEVGYLDSFPNAGIYTITVVAPDRHNCPDSATGHIYVANPVAGFASPLAVCTRDTIVFADTSHDLPNRSLAHFSWYFNGLGPISADTPHMPHVFNITGSSTSDSATVKLLVTDNIGCMDSVQRKIYFYQPVASFRVSQRNPCVGVPDTFINSATSQHGLHFQWDFGDGGFSNTASPRHTFTTAGIYTVTLTVTDTVLGCVADSSIVLNVTGVTAAIQMDDSVSLCIPFFVNFTASGTNTDTGFLHYIWTIQHATVYGPTRYEQYLAPGIDTIRLIDTNRFGCRDTAYAHVRVYGGTGDFYLSTHAGCSPLSVTAGFDLPPTLGIRWFVDAAEIPDHDSVSTVFINPGYHHIGMLLTDPGGCTSRSDDSVAVDTLLPAIGVANNAICAGVVDSFTNNSTSLFSTIVTTHWDYGDGTTGSGHTGTHAYTAPGTFTVTMTSTDALGCTNTITTTITVYPAVLITLMGHTTPVCGNGSVTIYDSVTGGTQPYSYLWTGPSGYTSADHNPVISPVTTSILGNYHLVVTDANGCQVMGDTTITYITPIPSAGTISGTDSVCVAASVHLSETATGGTWSATNANATVDGSGNVTGAINGIDSIYYVTSNACGADTARFIIRVLPLPTLGTIGGPTTVCPGATINLTATPAGGTWSAGSANATVGPTTGVVTGVTPGTVTISYTTSNSCGTTSATYNITVYPLPGFTPATSGVCVGSTITLAGGPSPTYTWSHANHTLDSLLPGTGGVRTVLGLSQGLDTFYLTSTATGCTNSVTVTVNPLPLPIVGPTHLCRYDTIRHSDATPGGRWSTSSTSVLPLIGDLTPGDTTFRGNNPGTAIDTYRVMSTGCYVTQRDTVFALPWLTVTPAASVYCTGHPDTLRAVATGGGTTFPSIAPFDYSWNPSTYLGPVNDSTVIAAGLSTSTIYTVTVTDARGCDSSKTATVTVICDGFCDGSGTIMPLGVGGNIPAGTYTGTYYLDNGIPGPGTITVSGSCVFSNAVVAIAPGKKLQVNNSASLVIDHSHFFCCRPDSMWQGILLASTTPYATMTVRNHSLIEDAVRAVDISGFPATATNVFTSKDAIFNCNKVGVYIKNFNGTGTFPFNISNTGFIARDLTGYYDGTRTYPFAWPSLAGDLLVPYAPPYGPYTQPPFRIDDPAGKPTTSGGQSYTTISCKDENEAYAGIQMTLVGNNSAAVYPGLLIQGNYYNKAWDSTCLFDNLNYGILDSSGDLTVRGAVFLYCHPSPGVTNGGVGIRAANGTSSGAGKYQLTANTLVPGPSDEFTTNRFYDCHIAIDAYNMHSVLAEYNDIHSSHRIWLDSVIGMYGIRNVYRSTTDLTGVTLDINHNYINNIDTGIMLVGQESIVSNFNINNNQLIATAPYVDGYMRQAIFASSNGGTGASTGALNITNNEVLMALNGIYVINSTRRYAITSNNNIYLIFTSTGNTYGIRHIACANNVINQNYVRSTDVQRISNAIGISGENNTLATITCDSVQFVNRAFNFVGVTSNSTTWRRNAMDSCKYGFYIQSGSIGSGAWGTSAFDNIWYGTWPSGTYHTFNAGSVSAASSTMYVRVNTGGYIYDPWINSQTSPIISVITFGYPLASCSPSSCFGSGLSHATDSTTAFCGPTGVTFPLYRDYLYGIIDSSQTDTSGPKQRNSSRNAINLGQRMRWVEQMHVWNALQLYPALADSSAALGQFRAFGHESRYAWLTNIEHAVYDGDIVTAQSLLSNDIDAFANTSTDSTTNISMADGVDADYVVANYLEYYNLYIKFMGNTLDGDDSLRVFALAGQCPLTDGEVVYQARGLATQLGVNVGGNDEDCVAAAESKGIQQPNRRYGSAITSDQRYTLYPNPNNGQITITRQNTDEKIVEAEVVDAMGRTVCKKQLEFSGSNARVGLPANSPAGLYLLKLTDSDGKIFNFKFVVQ